MSIVTAPFFGFKARGQIGKSLVYFGWKGLNVVRTWVKPANPNAPDQQVQRGIFADAVAMWQNILFPFVALDVQMWNFLAGLSADPLTGFNNFMKMFIDTTILGNTPQKFYNATLSLVGPATFTVAVSHNVSSADVTLWYGTSPTTLINSQARTEGGVAGGTSTFLVAGLTTKTIYYFQVKGTVGELGSFSGIGKQKTT